MHAFSVALVARRPSRFMLAALVLAGMIATPVAAQTRRYLAVADSLLVAGEVSRAEALYYAASRQQTKDPVARAALGRYLASRGAFKIGAELLSEAVQFGGDTAAIARARAPMLQAGDEWALLATLPHSPLSRAERARAEWMAAHPPAVSGADSVTVAFEPSSAIGLGRVRLVVGTDTLLADVDPSIDELVLGDYTRYASSVQVFTAGPGDRVAVLHRAAIGDLVLERIPARIDERLGPLRARIGLILLARLAPTVDAGAELLTLRRAGRVDAATGRRRVPLLFGFPGVRVARQDRFVAIESPAGRALLMQARWTLDLKRGELVLEVDARDHER
jgi:hypothetical protein